MSDFSIDTLTVETTLNAPTSATTASEISAAVSAHANLTNNPHTVTKTQVGLANVPNVDATLRSNHTGTQTVSTISDFNTTVGTATQTALNLKYDASNPSGYQTSAQVSASIQAVVAAAPAALDTLNELAAALGNDANFAGTVTTALTGKANLSGGNTFTGTQQVNAPVFINTSGSVANGLQFPPGTGVNLSIWSNGNDLNISPTFDTLFSPTDQAGRFRPSNDNTSGLGLPGSRWQSLRVGTGTSSLEGQVGIGTQTPAAGSALDVNGVGVVRTQLLVGGTAPVDITGTSVFPPFQIQGTNATQMAAMQFSNDINPPALNLLKSRGATVGAQGIVAADDDIGRLQFRASDGVNFQAAAAVRAAVDGTPGAGSMPGRLSFFTTPSASTTPVERIRIDKDGNTTVSNAGMLVNIPKAPLNLVASAAGQLKTQLNLVNKGGGGGAGSAIDFHTYDDQPTSTQPGARIGAIDNNFSADIILSTKAPGGPANAIAERMRVTNDGRVGIGATPVASAILQIESTTQGLLVPRMTTAQKLAIVAPVAGLYVYDTDDNGLWYYDGNVWVAYCGWQKKNSTGTLTSNSNVTLTNVTTMQANVYAGKTYKFEWYILFQSAALTTGIALSVGATTAVGTLNGIVEIPVAADGTAGVFGGQITAFGDVVIGTGVQAANTPYLARVFGVFACTTSGTIFPQFRSEVNLSQVSFLVNSRGFTKEI